MDSYDIDMTSISATVGLTYRIQVGAYNQISETDSDSMAVVLASVPSQSSTPTSISDGTYL